MRVSLDTAVDIPSDLDALIEMYARYDAGPNASKTVLHRIAYAKRQRLALEFGNNWKAAAPSVLQTDILRIIDCHGVLPDPK